VRATSQSAISKLSLRLPARTGSSKARPLPTLHVPSLGGRTQPTGRSLPVILSIIAGTGSDTRSQQLSTYRRDIAMQFPSRGSANAVLRDILARACFDRLIILAKQTTVESVRMSLIGSVTTECLGRNVKPCTGFPTRPLPRWTEAWQTSIISPL